MSKVDMKVGHVNAMSVREWVATEVMDSAGRVWVDEKTHNAFDRFLATSAQSSFPHVKVRIYASPGSCEELLRVMKRNLGRCA